MLEWYAIHKASPGYAEIVRRANEERTFALRSAFQVVLRQIGAGVRALFDLGARLKRRRAETTTITSLSALDDATLKDIGVRRADIPGLARALANGNARQATSGVVADLPAGMRLVADNAGSASQSRANGRGTEAPSRKAA